MWTAIANAIGGIAGAVGSYFGQQKQEEFVAGQNQVDRNFQRQINNRNRQSQERANRLNMMLARQANRQQYNIHRQNMAAQEEFAKSGIQWKVRDAQKAGLHPLAALGAQTISFAPQGVGMDVPNINASMDSAGSPGAVPSTEGYADMGQNIGRALQATLAPADQMQAMQLELAREQVTGAGLDNDIKRAELASRIVTSTAGQPPGIPDSRPAIYDEFGGVSGDYIKATEPSVIRQTRRDVADPRQPHNVVGSGPSVAYTKNAGGGYDPVIPPELADSFEQDWLGSLKWQLMNRVLPNVVNMPPPNVGQKAGDVVRWNSRAQHWEVISPSSRFPDVLQ